MLILSAIEGDIAAGFGTDLSRENGVCSLELGAAEFVGTNMGLVRRTVKVPGPSDESASLLSFE